MNVTTTSMSTTSVAAAGVRRCPSPRLLGVAMASVALLALSACGSDDSADAPIVTTEASAPADAAADTGAAAAAVKIDAMEGQALMASLGAELTVIDVRTPQEFAEGHVEGAINIDVEGGGFSAGIASLDTAAPYIVYCQSGRRSAIAAQAMVAAGFSEVHDMGGIQDWVAAGLPVVAG